MIPEALIFKRADQKLWYVFTFLKFIPVNYICHGSPSKQSSLSSNTFIPLFLLLSAAVLESSFVKVFRGVMRSTMSLLLGVI